MFLGLFLDALVSLIHPFFNKILDRFDEVFALSWPLLLLIPILKNHTCVVKVNTGPFALPILRLCIAIILNKIFFFGAGFWHYHIIGMTLIFELLKLEPHQFLFLLFYSLELSLLLVLVNKLICQLLLNPVNLSIQRMGVWLVCEDSWNKINVCPLNIFNLQLRFESPQQNLIILNISTVLYLLIQSLDHRVRTLSLHERRLFISWVITRNWS